MGSTRADKASVSSAPSAFTLPPARLVCAAVPAVIGTGNGIGTLEAQAACQRALTNLRLAVLTLTRESPCLRNNVDLCLMGFWKLVFVLSDAMLGECRVRAFRRIRHAGAWRSRWPGRSPSSPWIRTMPPARSWTFRATTAWSSTSGTTWRPAGSWTTTCAQRRPFAQWTVARAPSRCRTAGGTATALGRRSTAGSIQADEKGVISSGCIGCHRLRTTGITAYLEHPDARVVVAQYLAGHATRRRRVSMIAARSSLRLMKSSGSPFSLGRVKGIMTAQARRKKARRATCHDMLDAPPHMVAEVIAGSLLTHPRPPMRHARASSGIGTEIVPPFDFGDRGPGGWWIIFEPELHLGEDIVVAELVGWRRETMPEYPDAAYCTIAPDWVYEVLSPSTRRLNESETQDLYTHEGISHLWFVDPDARTQEGFASCEGQRLLLTTLADDAPASLPPVTTSPSSSTPFGPRRLRAE